jgi:hypothetical protein
MGILSRLLNLFRGSTADNDTPAAAAPQRSVVEPTPIPTPAPAAAAKPTPAPEPTPEPQASPAVAAAAEPASASNVSSLTVAALKVLAKDRGLKGYSKMKKADLVAALS